MTRTRSRGDQGGIRFLKPKYDCASLATLLGFYYGDTK